MDAVLPIVFYRHDDWLSRLGTALVSPQSADTRGISRSAIRQFRAFSGGNLRHRRQIHRPRNQALRDFRRRANSHGLGSLTRRAGRRRNHCGLCTHRRTVGRGINRFDPICRPARHQPDRTLSRARQHRRLEPPVGTATRRTRRVLQRRSRHWNGLLAGLSHRRNIQL